MNAHLLLTKILPLVAYLPLAALGAETTVAATADPPLGQGSDGSATVEGSAAARTPAPPLFANEASIGVEGVYGRNTAEFGRYNGLTTEGIDLVGDFALHSRASRWDPANPGGADGRYWDVTGRDLVIQTGGELANQNYLVGAGPGSFTDSRFLSATDNRLAPNGSIVLDAGNQGQWGVQAFGRSISYAGNIIESLYTVNGATATLNNGLTPFGGATNVPMRVGVTAAAFTTTNLTPYLDAFQTGTRRDLLGVQGRYISGPWTFTGSIQTEHKQGSMEEALRESWGGQAFALPVDYNTDRINLSAAYATRQFQATLQYTFSHFVDNYAGVFLPYPASVSPASPAVPFAETAVYALAPSTDAHFLTLMAAFSPAAQTRLNANLRYGFELQNAGFVPNTGDPGISAANFAGFENLNSALEGTTGNSLHAVAEVFQGNLTATSRFLPDVDSHAFAGVDGRRVQIDQYAVYGSGASSDANATGISYVVPQEWTKSKAGADVSYRFWHGHDSKLTVGYQFDGVSRSNAQVEHSTTSTESVRLDSSLREDLSGSLGYALVNRSGSLDYTTPWTNLGVTEGAAPSGAYYQAPMTANSVRLRLDYSPRENLSASLAFQYRKEDFHYPGISPGTNLVNAVEGVEGDRNFSISPDLRYTPNADLNLDVFYTFENIYYDNVGNGQCAASGTGVCAGSAGYFENQYSSSVQTLGAGLNWNATQRLKLHGSYTYSVGTVAFSEYNGVYVSSVTQSFQNVVNYPDIGSVMQVLTLGGEYRISPDKVLTFGYSFNYFRNDDWNDLSAPVQATTNTGKAISILTPGYASPNYRVSTIGVGIRIHW